MRIKSLNSKWIVPCFLIGALTLSNVWSKTPAKRSPANARSTPADSIRSQKEGLRIVGKVLLSDEVDYVFIQSSDLFLKIQRNLIEDTKNPSLDQPGGRVSMQVPQEAIIMTWSPRVGD